MSDPNRKQPSRDASPPAPHGSNVPFAGSAGACARWILRRVGIPPLLSAALGIAFAVPHPTSAEGAATRTTATANARIVTTYARTGPTGLISDARTIDVALVSRSLRNCQSPRPAHSPPPQPCRMIVYDMP